MKNSVLHPAASRFYADHGWLQSAQTFSFHGNYDPQRIQFGALRVLNDDTVNGGKGFGRHPHDNMEIISIPLEGTLEHQDSIGNVAVIRRGEIQVMSAGTGVYHTEFNKDPDEPVTFLQIWLYPKKLNVTPRYDQMEYASGNRHNRFQQILSPDPADEGVWINQDAWFHLAELDKGFEIDYRLKKDGNGVYLFVIDGNVEVDGQSLARRDGYGFWPESVVPVKALEKSSVLVIEVPEKW
ncbi:pirin family protein [Dyadobacter fermentans]|uniref:Pirin domain protein n=1 Tax=Dyadobacter fermentans (strain ATCC 700827 / DSM 18053 / CIP 107007 / KCTC 52180 / NS114) TaxID=471854 RepID=C6VYE6_DYAFD|nr:pirin family protein [Dyadobacter fermentans]ACT91625.1 Pirin domain protein [Dyadobacter fermentans DSM 18053]